MKPNVLRPHCRNNAFDEAEFILQIFHCSKNEVFHYGFLQ